MRDNRGRKGSIWHRASDGKAPDRPPYGGKLRVFVEYGRIYIIVIINIKPSYGSAFIVIGIVPAVLDIVPAVIDLVPAVLDVVLAVLDVVPGVLDIENGGNDLVPVLPDVVPAVFGLICLEHKEDDANHNDPTYGTAV